MIDKNFIYALVGASTNPEKFGNKILKDLIEGGYKVIPVNPNEKEIFGIKSYCSLSQIPFSIDVVICVVPSVVTEKIIDEIILLGIKNVWMQPGSESDVAIQKCLHNGINIVHNSCIMIQRKSDM
ncbi:MAG: CoA-binding protein [Candidatus Absconditabacteria bacterium]|nr:CoA-binding protein [Candidatus Absconditabacteria bacterium]